MQKLNFLTQFIMADDITNEGYQFDDDTSGEAEAPAKEATATDDSTTAPAADDSAAAPAADDGGASAPAADAGASAGSSAGGSTGGGKYATELMSKTIQAKFRTFYVDLKESSNGKFVKISEKSHGRKSTIMMDGEDVAPMIEALQEISKEL